MRHTLVRYIDAVNFPAGNPEADPTQESIEVWYLDQKTNEDGETVSWELASPGDVGGESVGRQMTTLCHWCLTGGYRGPNCGYTGPYFDKDGNPTDNPELDECNGLLTSGCEPRWGANNELPFGGFPAVSLIARS
jgi:lambda family phage minor tail protein L